MIEELQPNITELELARIVDYGHTFSPVIEMKALPELLHGEAVNIDMSYSLILSHLRNYLNFDNLFMIFNLMKSLKLPLTHFCCNLDTLWQSLRDATVHRGGLQRFPLVSEIGQVEFVNNITRTELEHMLEFMRSLNLAETAVLEA